MSDETRPSRGLRIPPMDDTLTPEVLEAIRQRVHDGIVLGGSYDNVFASYVQANTDRRRLFKHFCGKP